MSRLREFVKNDLMDSERKAIIASYEKFEEDGFIGDEPVRTLAQFFIRSLGITGDHQITLWMEKLAMECYRYYYHNKDSK